MKERIAIIGANDSILPLIRKAKEKNLETHVFAWATGAQGEREADFYYPISIDKKDQILEVCRGLNISAVASITSDFAVATVNYIARSLGLVGNSERTDVVARNKYKMRCAFKEAGLFTPTFCEAGADFQIDDAASFSYPVIVKPTDRWSSKGVTRVNNPNELLDAIGYAINESFERKAIIESFMEGPEYSAECICYRGDYHILAFTKKVTTGYPHYIETGHIQPSDIPKEKQDEVSKVIFHALKALDISNGAAHAEFRLLADGNIGIIEIGARMGGDCIGTDLTPISTGLDFVGMVVDVARGKKPDFSTVNQPAHVEIRFIIDKKDLADYYDFKNSHPELIVREGEFDFNFDSTVVDSSTRHGYYIFKYI